MSSAAARSGPRYRRTFHGRADQVGPVRREIARHLTGCPATDNAVLIASELAANAVTHSDSAGDFLTVRCDVHPAIHLDRGRGPRRPLGARSARWPPPRPLHHRGPRRAGQLGNRHDSDGNRIISARLDLPGNPMTPMTGPGRPPDVTGLTSMEL